MIDVDVLFVSLVKANLAAALAVLAVMMVRKPVRAMFGARLAYLLWLVVPMAGLAVLVPARLVVVEVASPTVLAVVREAALDPALMIALWLAGGIAMALWLLRSQARFMAEARAGRAGPAVVGLMRPRIVTPANFADVYSDRERRVILAHESMHLVRQDARANGVAALIRCVCWFNPLIHIAAYLMRIDQEMACDAQVVERHPKARRTYAEAMLKAELADRPLPLGCYWPAGTRHPLTERIAMLKHDTPGRLRRIAGVASLIALCAGAGLTAWGLQPQRTQYAPAPKAPQTAPDKTDRTERVMDIFVPVPKSPGSDRPRTEPLPADRKDYFEPVPSAKTAPAPNGLPETTQDGLSNHQSLSLDEDRPVDVPQKADIPTSAPPVPGDAAAGSRLDGPYKVVAESMRRLGSPGQPGPTAEWTNGKLTAPDSTTISARKIVWDETQGVMLFSGDVVRTDADGRTLKAEKMAVPLNGPQPKAQ